jgi:hypothetical protein
MIRVEQLLLFGGHAVGRSRDQKSQRAWERFFAELLEMSDFSFFSIRKHIAPP